jgi:hypothetical protein
MDFEFLTWIFGGARGADKSAVATINRALLMAGLFCQSALFSPLLQCSQSFIDFNLIPGYAAFHAHALL